MSGLSRAALVVAVALAPVAVPAGPPVALPGIGESVVTDEIEVTLVGAERLTPGELDTPDGRAAGGVQHKYYWFRFRLPGL
jgi:hypothetical protein